MSRLDFYASERQYVEHLAPIWHALPAERRGVFYVRYAARDRAAAERLETVEALHRRHVVPASDRTIVVASFGDYEAVPDRARVVFVEHGAGQRYSGEGPNPSHYAGGPGRERVVLFVCPSETVAEANRIIYPHAAAVAVGCPKLDPWHAGDRGHTWPPVAPRRPVVAVSFHFDYPGHPEARNAWRYYRHALRRLLTIGSPRAHVIGHAHPRQLGIVKGTYRSLGIEVVAEFEDVLDRADVYVADNSSTLFEFASTTRPVVFLNAPWYRRDVEHGLRFWSGSVIGHHVNEPPELGAVVERALAEPACDDETYRRIMGEVYAHRDGKAAARAARAILLHGA